MADVGFAVAGAGDQGGGRHPALALPGRCAHQQPHIGAHKPSSQTSANRARVEEVNALRAVALL